LRHQGAALGGQGFTAMRSPVNGGLTAHATWRRTAEVILRRARNRRPHALILRTDSQSASPRDPPLRHLRPREDKP
jgi:hypothetical protein